MKLLFSILLSIITINCAGQTRTVTVRSQNDGDTAAWFQNKLLFEDQLELERMITTTHLWHIRLSTNKQVIEIWEDIEHNKMGKVTSWTREYSSELGFSKGDIYTENVFLNVAVVKQLMDLADSCKIVMIPDRTQIENWYIGFDGITYEIEYATIKTYNYRSYWTPSAQTDVQEAIVIQRFVDRFVSISVASKLWRDFQTRIPFSSYANNGPMITVKAQIPAGKIRKTKKRKKN
ncbi:MAG: hypothetical protein H6600_09530 [Flavobacteriales bacterium]|nr:hypothetical protein [Flavobacteriales bacterium]MCB9198690.1 hypothetical protein [Flavobacteriales bacterium]